MLVTMMRWEESHNGYDGDVDGNDGDGHDGHDGD